jgi:hypothetical protein
VAAVPGGLSLTPLRIIIIIKKERRQMPTQRETVRKKYEEQNSTVKPEEARSQK